MDKEKVFVTRATNLKKILNDEYDGNKKHMARRLEVQLTSLNKYLNPNSDRPCGEYAARRIERRLGLTFEYLDDLHQKDLQIYFIAVDIDIRFSYQIIEYLKREEAVLETWLTIGDHDLLLKVAVENYRFLDLLLSSLSQLPGFNNSHSFQTIGSMSWQHSQPEKMDIYPRNEDLIHRNGIESFKHKRADYYFSQIEKLYADEITVKKRDIVTLHSNEFIKGVKRSLLSTRYLGMEVAEQEAYEAKEAELISSGVAARRIIVVEDDLSIKDMELIENEAAIFSKMDCPVRFVFRPDWRPTMYSDNPEYFVILDDKNVVLRNEPENQLTINSSKVKVNEYTTAFDANWRVGKTSKQIKASLK